MQSSGVRATAYAQTAFLVTWFARGIVCRNDNFAWGGQREMLRLGILFLVIALIAFLFGFIGVAGLSIEIAKILFFVFIVLAILSLLGGAFRSPPA